MFQLTTIRLARLGKSSEFEEKHPRGEGGRFTRGGTDVEALPRGTYIKDEGGEGFVVDCDLNGYRVNMNRRADSEHKDSRVVWHSDIAAVWDKKGNKWDDVGNPSDTQIKVGAAKRIMAGDLIVGSVVRGQQGYRFLPANAVRKPSTKWHDSEESAIPSWAKKIISNKKAGENKL